VHECCQQVSGTFGWQKGLRGMSIFNLRSVLIGILATLAMDILSVGAIKLHWIAPLPPRLIGRWFGSVGRGRLLHSDIGQVLPINHEIAIAVPMHYAVGITLALVYLLGCSALGMPPRDPVAALGFALCTNLLPWLLMFPAMGYGWSGSRGPTGTRLFLSSLVTHCFYGVGLWFGTLILSSSATRYC
jgi:hypothetical protein